MDAIDSRNPTNLETKKINDSEINVEVNYVVQDHHLIKNTRVIVLDKLNRPPTSEKYISFSIHQPPKNISSSFSK